MAKRITAGKFVMLCLSGILLDDYAPLKPFRGALVVVTSERQRRQVEEYATRVGIELGAADA